MTESTAGPSPADRDRIIYRLRHAEPVRLDAERITLRSTSPQTLVNRCLVRAAGVYRYRLTAQIR